MKKAASAITGMFIILLSLSYSCSMIPEKVTLETLLDEMVDRENMARFPDPYYTCIQSSSYDRRSVSPDSAGWFANADRSNFIRTEENNGRVEQVLLDAEGPGAIVRFWITFANYQENGILRFYFDGENEPRLSGEPFNLISRGELVSDPLSASVSLLTEFDRRGHNLYLPIPYSNHLKVTYESDRVENNGGKPGTEAFYYQINYRTYQGKVKVKSFEMSDLLTYAERIAEVQNLLANRIKSPEKVKAGSLSFQNKLQPGESTSFKLDGNKAIRSLRLKLEADNLPQALRSTVMAVNFDGNRTVWSPVGDFFGTGYQLYPSRTWYQEVSDDGIMEVFWIMPFRESCVFEFTNLGSQPVEIKEGSVSYSKWKWGSNSMYFGASWRQYTHDTEKPRDLNYTILEGAGVFVGDGVALFDCNPGWWGEGDEKIYVDNESFPSHFGTGTEDYYGYAWCRHPEFSHPFISQPAGYANRFVGNTVNMRYRALDAIPFTESLRFDMELLHWTKTVVNFSPVSYWYMKPGGICHVQPETEEAKKPVIMKRQDIFSPILGEKGIIEGEDLILSHKSNDTARVVTFILPLQPRWQILEMRWTNARYDEDIAVKFMSEQSGDFRIKAKLSNGQDHGRFSISVNDGRSPVQVNSYSKEFAMTTIDLGNHKINAGENVIRIRCLEEDPKGEAGSVFGLDNLIFEKR